MGLINILITGLVIVLLVMTAIAEPQLTLKYWKSFFVSGYKLVGMAVKTSMKMYNSMTKGANDNVQKP